MTKQESKAFNQEQEDNTMLSKLANKVKGSNDSGESEADRFHIGSRIDQGVEEHKTTTRNRSSEVIMLEREYATMKKNLHVLKTTAKDYYSTLEGTGKLRTTLAATLAEMAEGSPIHDAVGAPTESPASIMKPSLFSIEQETAAAFEGDLDGLDKVIDFVTEWEAIITDKVESEMHEVNYLHKRLNHYQDKVHALRSKMDSIEESAAPDPVPKHPIGKGVMSSEKLKDKLGRNETKFDKAWKAHEARATKLCDLLEEVTKRGWKLLHHLVRLVMKFEASYAANLNKHLSKLPSVMDEMTEAYNMHADDAAHRAEIPVAVDEYDSDSTTDDESNNDESAEKGKMHPMNLLNKIKA